MAMRIYSLVLFGLVAWPTIGYAQKAAAKGRVPAHQMYERMTAIVPMAGTGTLADPKRPMFAPTAAQHGQARTAAPGANRGIIAYSFHPSDDGKWAIVEFVARDRSAFKAISDAERLTPGLKTFDRERHSKDDIEAECKKLKKDFDLTKLSVRMR